MLASQCCTWEAMRAPPNTPVRTLTRVMPTCTVGRKRCGSSDSALGRRGAADAFALQHREAGAAGGDQGQFAEREQAVQQDQQQDDDGFQTDFHNSPRGGWRGWKRRDEQNFERIVVLRCLSQLRPGDQSCCPPVMRLKEDAMPTAIIPLTLLALLPFVFLAMRALSVLPVVAQFSLMGLVDYAALMLAFSGGVHWGMALLPDAPRPTARAIAGLLPIAAAWVSILVAQFFSPTVGLVVLILAIWPLWLLNTVRRSG